jgi:hypothetical protein
MPSYYNSKSSKPKQGKKKRYQSGSVPGARGRGGPNVNPSLMNSDYNVLGTAAAAHRRARAGGLPASALAGQRARSAGGVRGMRPGFSHGGSVPTYNELIAKKFS